MKILHLLFIILMVISSQAKFNSHINQKDLPIKKSKPKDTSSAETKENEEKTSADEKTTEKSNASTEDDNANNDNKETAEKPYRYEWKAFKGIVFNRDVNPFAKMAKSFSDHAAKRKEKAEKKKAQTNSKSQLENESENNSSKETSSDANDSQIKNEEK